MKKILSLLLAVVLVASLAACGSTQNEEKMEAPASSLEILEKIWNDFPEEERFPVEGGDAASHLAQLEKDENYVPAAGPGKFSLTETEDMATLMLVPQAEQSKVTDAATMYNPMMRNNFSCGVYRVGKDNVQSFAQAMKTNVSENQWMCGMPEGLRIVTFAEEYVLVLWGTGAAVDPFMTHLKAVYPGAKIVTEETFS